MDAGAAGGPPWVRCVQLPRSAALVPAVACKQASVSVSARCTLLLLLLRMYL
jgi:hypothetical protein